MSAVRRATFKQADACRALKAAVAAGLSPSGYTVAPVGTITVTIARDDGSSTVGNSFDSLIGGRS